MNEAIAITPMMEAFWAVEKSHKELFKIKDLIKDHCSDDEKQIIDACRADLESLTLRWNAERSRWS